MGLFDKKEVKNPDAAAADGAAKVEERSAADLIAESISTALRPFAQRLDEVAQRVDEVATQTRKPEPKAEPIQTTSVLENEDAAFAQRLTPVVMRQLELEARMVRNDIKAEYAGQGFGDLWAQFEAEINTTLEGSPLVDGVGKALRGSPDYIRNVVDMVFGRAARKAGMRFDNKAKQFFLESASGDSGRSVVPTDDGLTDGQRKVFARMGVPADRRKEVMSKLTFVN